MLVNIKLKNEKLILNIISKWHTITDEKHADVVIYDGYDLPKLPKTLNQKGVFLINANGKTADEIDYMLENRLYSPIFFD